MMNDHNVLQSVGNHLRTAHDKLMQVQQTLDNRELNEQKLLEQALDAVNRARQAIDANAAK